jgi:hypothetical protein
MVDVFSKESHFKKQMFSLSGNWMRKESAGVVKNQEREAKVQWTVQHQL